MIRKLIMTALLGVMPIAAFGQVSEAGKPVVIKSSADIVGVTYWSADTVYLLDKKVIVESGEVLYIEAGTIIKGLPGTLLDASALVVARGGKIHAEGTKTKPIIFTAQADNVDLPNDLAIDASTRGLWGGLIVMGYATVRTATGSSLMEGLDPLQPYAVFGGGATPNDNDNSGVIRYVSLRHGGVAVEPGKEINGLTMGGVGRGTILEYVEAFQNFDDGFEWFGGTVNGRYLATVFCDDDGFDWDFGYSGSLQFLFNLKDSVLPANGSHGFESDYCTPGGCPAPDKWPTVSNVTFLGMGKNSADLADNPYSIALRTGTGGYIYNSIFGDSRRAIQVVNATTLGYLGTQMILDSNLFWDYSNGTTWDKLVGAPTAPDTATVAAYMAAHNSIANPLLNGITRHTDGTLDPRPGAGSPALSGFKPVSDPNGVIKNVSFRGAFDPNTDPWLCNWSATDFNGFLVTCQSAQICDCETDQKDRVDTLTISDIGPFTALNAGTLYYLDKKVVVESGEVMTIGAGTVIKGLPGSLLDASALVVAKGGKILASGTSDCPIIMTADADDVDNPNDLPLDASSRGLWGSLILMGKATVRTATGTSLMEGLDPLQPYATFGGGLTPDDNDNTGVIRYVSLRHGGVAVEVAKEINGLTMGGVGRGTKIEYIECFQNFDDGFEWFGGTVNCRYLSAVFCDDDGFDWDFGYSGSLQYLFNLKDSILPANGSHGFESDYCTPGGCIAPLNWPTISNVTFIGMGKNSADISDNPYTFALRTGTGGYVYNSIFSDSRRAVQVVNATTLGYLGTQMVIDSNLFWDYSNGATWNKLVGAPTAPDTATVAAYMSAHNSLANPMLRGINRKQLNLLDPRPKAASPAASGRVNVVDPQSFINNSITYRGAFDPAATSVANTWLGGWSFAYCGNMLGDVAGGCCIGVSGNVDGDPLEGVDISDLSALIDFLYISFTPPVCMAEANTDGDIGGGVDISDLSALIDFLYISFTPTATCQ